MPVSGCCFNIWRLLLLHNFLVQIWNYSNLSQKSRVDGMQILYKTSLHGYFKRHCSFREETVLKSSDAQECFICSALV